MAAPARFAAKMTAGVFTQPVAGIRLPDRDYLVGEYLLGGSQVESVKNRANPASPLTAQGAVIYNPASATVRPSLTAGFGFYTNIIPDEEFSLIVVRKNCAIASGPRILNMDAVSQIFGPRQSGTDNYFNMGEASNITGAKRTRPTSASEIYFEAGVQAVPNSQLGTIGQSTMYYYTSGGVQQVVVSPDPMMAGPRRGWKQMVIGSDKSSDTIATNSVEVFFVALYNKPLTAAGIDAAYQAIVTYYATVGVTVV